jgi:hypothetical protein
MLPAFCKVFMKSWPWVPPGRGDILAFLLGAAFLVVILLAYIFVPSPRPIASGFGPEWDCVAIPQGDPVCIKKAKAPSTTPTN